MRLTLPAGQGPDQDVCQVCPDEQEVELTTAGDRAAAHAAGAIDTPVCRHGCCFRCCLPKSKWFDVAAINRAWRRNFAYQCTANHVNLRRILGDKLEPGEDFRCPHCNVLVDEALEKKEAEEWEAADEAGRDKIRLKHSKSHSGALRGKTPLLPMDNCKRASSALHRRMNACGNNIAATFMAVPFKPKMRDAANELLKKHKVVWRFPTKKKKRASTPLGNDARKFHSCPGLIVGLVEIFYPDAKEGAQKELVDLRRAAAGATDVRNAPDEQQARPLDLAKIEAHKKENTLILSYNRPSPHTSGVPPRLGSQQAQGADAGAGR